MAQYSHLPLYLKTYEFIKLVYRLTRQFPKEYKYSLGSEMQKIIWEVLDEIIKTNSLPNAEKKIGLEKISLLFDCFKIRFRLAYDLEILPVKKFVFAQERLEEIGKMIGGWQKWNQ
jgi:hypothetical protein